MSKISFGKFLIFMFFLTSLDLLAQPPYEPNVFECASDEFSLTYSLSAWHGEPIWILREADSRENLIKRQGWLEIQSVRTSIGTQVRVLEEHFLGLGDIYLTILIPRTEISKIDESVSFETVLIKTTPQMGTNSYLSMKCRGRLHIE